MVQIPRPKRGEGQWAFGYREPLNPNEQSKKDEDPLDIRDRILRYAASGETIFQGDLRGKFRWWGLYTQRPEEDGFFMQRVRIPGGHLTSEQTREIGLVAIDYGRDVLDVTNRQNVQYHWIRIESVPEMWKRFEKVGLRTIEACGDTPRNILGCPLAGIDALEVFDASGDILALEERMTGTKEFSNFPRKYKQSLTGCRHQCAIHEINDFSLVGVVGPGGEPGYDVWVGGGLSSTPHFAQRLGAFVRRDQVVDVAVGVAAIFRDYGYRRSRNKARLKFLVSDWGPEKFREVLEELYLGYKLADGPAPEPAADAHRDHTGVGIQRDGSRYVGFALKAGRTSGSDFVAFADLADRYGAGRLRTTVQQKMVILDVPPEKVAGLCAQLEALGYPVESNTWRTGMMACTGIEFCKLSIVETKHRATWLEDELTRRLPGFTEPFRINLVGCPNSCGRYQIADIGFMGVLVTERTAESGEVERLEGFNVHVGGHLGEGHQFGRKVPKVRLRADELPSYVERMVRVYQERREGQRTFGDWVASLSTAEIDRVAQAAAAGLERVGPRPVSTEQIRPDD